MGSFLFNILTKFTQVKDLVLTAGPGVMISLSDVLARLSEGAALAGEYIKRVGSATPAEAQAAMATDPQAGKTLEQLRALQAEIEAAKGQEIPAQPAEAQAALGDFIKNINPETRKAILAILSAMLSGVLGKAAAPQQQQPAQHAPKAAEGGPKADAKASAK